MKNLKQIREAYDVSTRKEDTDNRRFTSLVRAGLYDPKKLPALKRAFEKGPDHMTAIEKRMLLNLLDSLMAQVVSNQPVFQKVRTNVLNMSEGIEPPVDYTAKYDPRGEKGQPRPETIPAVLILKRKAIRVYPDNQKVALYYAQAIDKYISVPFGTFGDGGVGSVNEMAPVAALAARTAVSRVAKSKIKSKVARKVVKKAANNVLGKSTAKPSTSSKPSTPERKSRAGGGGIAGGAVAGAIRGFSAAANEEVLPVLKKMVSENVAERTIAFGEKEILINSTVAKKIVAVHESMNKQNRKTMETMLNENIDSFNKVVTFATRY